MTEISMALLELLRKHGLDEDVDSIVNAVEDWSAFPNPSWAADFSNGDDMDLPGSWRESQFVGWYMDMMRNASPLAAKMLKFYVDHLPVSIGTFPGDAEYIFLHPM